MQDYFKLTDKGLKIEDDTFALFPDFNDLYKRDSDKRKNTAYKELTYIFIMADYRSPGIRKGYTGKRLSNYAKQFAKLNDDWKPDRVIYNCIDVYIAERDGVVTSIYKSILAGFFTSKKSIDFLNDMIANKVDSLQENDTDLSKELVQALTSSVKELISLSTSIPENIAKLEDIIKKVNSEQKDKRLGRGNITITNSMIPN